MGRTAWATSRCCSCASTCLPSTSPNTLTPTRRRSQTSRRDTLPSLPQLPWRTPGLIITRPEIDVYVRTFDGFALTADSWERQRQILLDDLIGKKVKQDEFFCAMYNSPMEMSNRRNEIWVQAEEGDSADVSSVVHQLLHDELPHHENHPHPHQ